MSEITNPRQVVLVTSRAHVNIMGKDMEKDNIITLAWHMPTSFDPELYAISIGKPRYSYELIKKSGVFAVNFMPYTTEKQCLFAGTHHGEHMDKFEKAGLTKEEAEKIDCPVIKEAVAQIECEVIDEFETGDHVIFVGKVLNSKLRKKNEKRLFQGVGYKFTTTK